MSKNQSEWQTIIGLEIHAALNTKTKLFSRAPNSFGSLPNKDITPLCTGEPGTLPILNQAAVHKAIKFGCAVEGKIAHKSYFDRKTYFYPDNCKNYQITQHYQPIILGGIIIAELGDKTLKFEIERAHLEEDAATLKHYQDYTTIDFNRSGIPLLEIVSTPTIHSPQAAVAYAKAIKVLLEYLDICDGRMDQGSLRIDANVSIRKKGTQGLKNKTEIKNLNSFKNLEEALEAEINRQIKIYTYNPTYQMPSSTYRWDTITKSLVMMRSKESIADYLYFTDPDLLPLLISDENIKEALDSIPELPHQRYQRYTTKCNLPRSQALFLTYHKSISDYFDNASEYCQHYNKLYNVIFSEFNGRLKPIGKNITSSDIPPKNIAQLINILENRAINSKIAKKIISEMISSPQTSPDELINKNNLHQPLDDMLLQQIIQKVIENNRDLLSNQKLQKDKIIKYLIGESMKMSSGRADPQKLNLIIKDKLTIFFTQT